MKFEVKSQLAKLLATENITMRHDPASKTAYFDIKSRCLILPVWKGISEDLYDLLVVHEVGHALNTPLNKWVSAIETIARTHHNTVTDRIRNNVKNFLNVVEDARIDKLQKRRYPGSKKNYNIGYKELNEVFDFFGLSNKDINSYIFIDRANIYFKSTGLPINFSPVEKKFIKRMEDLETFDEVIALTSEIYKAAKEEAQTMQSRMVGDDSDEDDDDEEGDEVEFEVDLDFDEDGEDDEDNDEEDGEDDENGEDSEDQSSVPKKVKGQENDGSSTEKPKKVKVKVKSKSKKGKDDEEDTKSKDKSNNGAGPSDVEEEIRVVTEEIASQAVEKFTGDSSLEIINLVLPRPFLKTIVDDYKVVLTQINLENSHRDEFTKAVRDFNKWRTSETETLSFMIKEFEMRKAADAYSRISTAKTGVINMNKLPRYKFDEDLFRKVSVVPTGKNHGFFMILDWSGSMTSNLRNTIKQLLSLTLFCRRMRIPFEVYTFRTGGLYPYDNNGGGNKQWDYTVGDDEGSIAFGEFKLRNMLSSRMDTATFNKACVYLWMLSTPSFGIPSDPLNGTPLNQAILACPEMINEFRKRNKLQIVNTIVLTDGASDPAYINMPRSYNSMANRAKNRLYSLHDKDTKKTYFLEGVAYSHKATPQFLRILKDKTDCNLLGFFLVTTPHLGHLVGGVIDTTVTLNPANIASWTKNNYFGIQGIAGYDEYYIVRTFKQEPTNVLEVNGKMTDAILKRTFINFADKKRTNRILLTSFVDRISKNLF